MLDEELAKSLFDSPEAVVNQVISVNEFSYRVIGVYTSNEAKTAKPLGLVVFHYDQYLSQLILILMKSRTSSFVSMITSLTQTLGPELAEN